MGLLDFLHEMEIGFPSLEESRKDVLRTELDNGIVIDTCKAFDTGKWETCVLSKDHAVVPEQYNSKEEAEDGHLKWVAIMTVNPNQLLKDITMDSWLGEFGLGEDDDKNKR